MIWGLGFRIFKSSAYRLGFGVIGKMAWADISTSRVTGLDKPLAHNSRLFCPKKALYFEAKQLSVLAPQPDFF